MYEFWVTWTHDPVLSKSSILPTWNRKSRYVLKSVHAVMTNFVGEFHFTLRVGISDQVSRSNHFVKVTKRYVSSEHHRIAVTWPSLHRSTYFELSIEADVWNANLILTLDTSYYREWNNLIALPDSLKQNILKLHAPCTSFTSWHYHSDYCWSHVSAHKIVFNISRSQSKLLKQSSHGFWWK